MLVSKWSLLMSRHGWKGSVVWELVGVWVGKFIYKEHYLNSDSITLFLEDPIGQVRSKSHKKSGNQCALHLSGV